MKQHVIENAPMNVYEISGLKPETWDIFISITDEDFLKEKNVLRNYAEIISPFHLSPVDGYFSLTDDMRFLVELTKKERADPAVARKYLYEYIDELLDRNAFHRVDNIIKISLSRKLTLKTLVGFLTITHSWRKFLKMRPAMIAYTRQIAESSGLTSSQIDKLLSGF